MAGKSKFVIAENNIKSFFKQSSRKVFTKEQLAEIFDERKVGWSLSLSTYADKFIEQLLKREILKKIELSFEGYFPDKERFIVEDASIFQIATSLANKSYLSHYSAVWMNGLTTQIPKTIYITFEQTKKAAVNRTLTQEAIDSAFSKPQRRTLSRASYGDYTFVILNGMFTNRMGVHSVENVAVTNIERTLIDITVRPSYAGGVFSVLEAYQNAIDRISINKLIATLDNMDFIYPYHQAVGFYLERAGYKGNKLEELRLLRSKEFKFYLTYEIAEKEYSEDWKIYFPKGL